MALIPPIARNGGASRDKFHAEAKAGPDELLKGESPPAQCAPHLHFFGNANSNRMKMELIGLHAALEMEQA